MSSPRTPQRANGGATRWPKMITKSSITKILTTAGHRDRTGSAERPASRRRQARRSHAAGDGHDGAAGSGFFLDPDAAVELRIQMPRSINEFDIDSDPFAVARVLIGSVLQSARAACTSSMTRSWRRQSRPAGPWPWPPRTAFPAPRYPRLRQQPTAFGEFRGRVILSGEQRQLFGHRAGGSCNTPSPVPPPRRDSRFLPRLPFWRMPSSSPAPSRAGLTQILCVVVGLAAGLAMPTTIRRR